MMMNCPINPYPQSAEGTATEEEKPKDNENTGEVQKQYCRAHGGQKIHIEVKEAPQCTAELFSQLVLE